MTRVEALYVCAALGIWMAIYFGMDFGMDRAYYALGCQYALSYLCAQLLDLKHLVAAVLPAYLVGRWIGRGGMAFGVVVSLGGWLIINLAQAILGPNSFDAWHLLANYIVIGALAGGVGQLHRRPRAMREL